MQELPTKYNPKETEGRIYGIWEKSGAFTPKAPIAPDAPKPFVIVIPPPNVTGSLHMGHALNNTIQDILIRRSRMKGVPTLWVPGTDHAGIATQNVVEKQLAKDPSRLLGRTEARGITRQELGREKFIDVCWQWVDEYGHIIIDQLKKLGCSCDWSRQRFTMDEEYSEAVKTAFKHYYDKGWIYQGERVINWCVRCQTALSDIEVEHKEVQGKLWFIKYDNITVATTRPETMLGDAAVAINPDDKRYKDLVGKKIKLPLMNREIPIIADIAVDPKFGTGAVKVTPAHDMNDFEIGKRHELQSIKVISELGKITQQGGKYAGQKALEARENIIKDLETQGLIEKVQDYSHEVPHCYRCAGKVEQLISKQWFLKMKELAKPAIEAVEKDEIKFTPLRWKKVYLDWMKNLKDWCISRQIWWGHKIPIEGSDDVLDTWFSSALWPFATLGWPKKTKDLTYFYPTTVLSTARDIIYLWVARMIFSGFEFMREKPFSEVYIHPTIFTLEGKRMSKSLGTGVDPLELIEKYGADATRFGLAYINTGIQDIKFDENAILAGQKFANKIWNIARFVLQNASSKLKTPSPRLVGLGPKNSKLQLKTESDKIIIDKLNLIIKSTDKNLDNFRFGQAAHDLYDFVWHDFADIYIENSKSQILNPKLNENTQIILLHLLTSSLRLLHPFMPFITEEIWQTLHQDKLVEDRNLITAQWPK